MVAVVCVVVFAASSAELERTEVEVGCYGALRRCSDVTSLRYYRHAL